ncbi:hypothetical protein KAFR_0E01830 [Kazachstania africana CBS 2517]|uniref:DNA-directed RNA polymerase III subunit RPC9 n=1 Tax=Kazachstania africana (strain ATCC 22294 / BCRC 22015 / CBS 2517 / CECT 1963 / NBRC 1671 / NRRL Y-8276) TaxID=1071382 RepID=H2AVD7_KAZAF|nr:hypothetical protein KAFR_0E01830 [Kazachstania africana CBS 2517]CCF58337.1 hypothetical protein KAFR_0E01830 [Kazachstania africana CBS 2517]
MKIIETRDSFLSDYEVLQFLSGLERKHLWDEETLKLHQKDRKKRAQTKRPYNHPALQAITRDAISFLKMNKNYVPQEDEVEEERTEHEKSPLCRLNDKTFSEFVLKLNKFDLFKAEKLQIVNQLPANMVHLYSIVEECDSRFSEEQIDEILEIVKEYSQI